VATTLVCFLHLHTGLRTHRASGVPRALSSERAQSWTTARARNASRECEHTPWFIAAVWQSNLNCESDSHRSASSWCASAAGLEGCAGPGRCRCRRRPPARRHATLRVSHL